MAQEANVRAARAATKRRGIRWYLFQVQLAAVVPIGVLAAALLYLHWQAQQEQRERLQIESVRLLAAAVDNALNSSIERLSILARLWGSNATDEIGLHAQASAAVRANPDWSNIIAFDAAGNRSFQADRPFGAPTPSTWRPEVWGPVIDDGTPVVSDVFMFPDRGVVVSVGVPVIHDGRVTHVLIADLNLVWYDELTARQGLPDGAVAAIFDRNYKFVARSSEGPERRGGDPTPKLIDDMKQFGESLGRYTNLNGTAVYTAVTYTRHGWGVGFATPSAPVDNAFWMHLLTFGFLWLLALIAGLTYAVAKARPVASSLEAIEAQAEQIARGQRVTGVPSSGVEEVDNAIVALEQGSDLLQRAVHDRVLALETERQARTEAESANRAKDQFLAVLGHELRNPLAAITNATAIIRDSRHTPEQLRFSAAVIERQSEHLHRLIDDLLDAGRAMTDKISLDRAPMDLAAAAREVIESLRTSGLLDERTVELDAEPARIDADATRVEQVLTNLLGNAARYTKPGGYIRVRITTTPNEAVVEMSDDGCGIAEADLPMVFEPFFQSSASREHAGGGLGVGLTLARKLVRLHGGEVEAASDGPGRGATFTVRLPLSRATAESASAQQARPAVAEDLTVLVVEDNADTRETLRLALEMRGCRVLHAGDAVTALEVARRERPAVALLDIGLPGLDGYELARLLRAELGEAIPLIALTGYGTASDERRSLDAGFDRHLTKPVDVDELVEIVVRSATPLD